MESFPEISAKVSVDERVECGIKVANPEECGDDSVRATTSRPADVDADVPDKEGQPA